MYLAEKSSSTGDQSKVCICFPRCFKQKNYKLVYYPKTYQMHLLKGTCFTMSMGNCVIVVPPGGGSLATDSWTQRHPQICIWPQKGYFTIYIAPLCSAFGAVIIVRLPLCAQNKGVCRNIAYHGS